MGTYSCTAVPRKAANMTTFGWLKKSAITAACVVALGSALVQAGTFDERTLVTFSNPVRIPGQVLPAGTYGFMLSPVPLERDMVQIFNARESRLIASVLTVPVMLARRSGEAAITLAETPAGSPPAVRDYFYEGTVRGHKFIYPGR
jgi:hypothetical protein